MEDGYTWNDFPKKRIGFLAYEREKDYLCKVKVMDIPQSIMQRTGWASHDHGLCMPSGIHL